MNLVQILLALYVAGVVACLGYIVLSEMDSWHRRLVPKPLSRSWWLQIAEVVAGSFIWPLLPIISWVRRRRRFYKQRAIYRRLKAENHPALKFWDASKYE